MNKTKFSLAKAVKAVEISSRIEGHTIVKARPLAVATVPVNRHSMTATTKKNTTSKIVSSVHSEKRSK